MSARNIGKLYKCSEYFLLIYPTKEKAAGAYTRALDGRISPVGDSTASPLDDRTVDVGPAARKAIWWSKELDCQVRCSEPNEIFMFIKQEEQFVHVLFGEKQGWILYKNWLQIIKCQ